MSTISLRLPDSLHEAVKKLAAQDGVSINQFVSLAVAEKLSALVAQEYLSSRAARGSRRRYVAALDRAADEKPGPTDEI